jgi:predicted transcriptional regulator
MKSEDIGSLPVVQEGQLVAILTDRDIVLRAVAESVSSEAGRDADCSITRFSETRPRQGSKDPRR